MARLEEEIKDPIKKCQKKREVRTCEKCCRYAECWQGTAQQFKYEMPIDGLLGAMVFSALHDLFMEVPSLKKCKTLEQKARRRQIIYEKATAENFFKSKMFKMLNLDLEYLKGAYWRVVDEEEKIPRE